MACRPRCVTLVRSHNSRQPCCTRFPKTRRGNDTKSNGRSKQRQRDSVKGFPLSPTTNGPRRAASPLSLIASYSLPYSLAVLHCRSPSAYLLLRFGLVRELLDWNPLPVLFHAPKDVSPVLDRHIGSFQLPSFCLPKRFPVVHRQFLLRPASDCLQEVTRRTNFAPWLWQRPNSWCIVHRPRAVPHDTVRQGSQ